MARTFREALAAEALEERLQGSEGQAALLALAGGIASEDLGRWAEPYALLAGGRRIPTPWCGLPCAVANARKPRARF